MSITVKWYGDKVKAIVQAESERAYTEVAKELANAARAKAPVSPGGGDLRDSIYYASKLESTFQKKPEHGRMPKIPKGGAVAGAAIFYARFVEFGVGASAKRPWSTAAQPFFRPAFDEIRGKFGRIVAENVGKKLR